MVETESQLTISCHQMKLPVLTLGYIQLSCWSKGSLGNPQTTWAIDKAIGCSLQTDSKTPSLKTTPKQLTEHGEVELVPT